MADEKQKLTIIFNAARLDATIIAHMMDVLQLQSVTDYVNYVEHAKYESELQVFILDTLPKIDGQPHPLTSSRIQLTRLRTAWEQAFSAHEKKKKRRLEGTVEDQEESLDEMTRSDLLNAFIALHSLSPSMHLMPSDSLLGRVYREFERGTMTMMPVKKAISLYLASLPCEQQLIEVGQGVQLNIGKADLPPIRKIARYYFGLRILANAKAITGCHRVESKLEANKHIVFAAFQPNLDYADYWLRKASAFNMAESVVLDWAKARDEETRAKEVELVRGGWPQGEAILKALQVTEISWTVGPTGNNSEPPPEKILAVLPLPRRNPARLREQLRQGSY